MDHGRRSFLRGRVRREPPPRRPPWALAEAEFTQRCTRCGDCVRVCETAILINGPGGFPTVDFQKAGCTYCGRCRDACKPGALSAPSLWQQSAVIGDNCLVHQKVECRACGDACPIQAIKFFPRPGNVPLPVVQTDCDGCGFCVSPCPVNAMTIKAST